MDGSLSEEILFGTLDSVKKLVQLGADLNERDDYGYRPLIQATFKGNIEIVSLLLEHGALIDQTDIAGLTALQWAVHKSNLNLTKLFLEKGANPNHHSTDGQPILVYPIMREQKELISLLQSFGAKMIFAEDYINAKRIGHRYELIGEANIVNAFNEFITLDFEGFYLEFTVGMIYASLQEFIQSPKGQTFKHYGIAFSKILNALRKADQLIAYRNTEEVNKNHASIRLALSQDLVVIPVSYAGHAITLIKYGNIFAKCDRGVKNIVDTTILYKTAKPHVLNADFLKELLYENKTDEFINWGLKEILDLSPFITLPTESQIAGNCSWANVEASVPAMLFMLLFKGDVNNRSHMAALKKSIMKFYEVWVEWDKDRSLDNWINNFHQANDTRKVSAVSILACILKQRCHAENKNDVARALKILKILTIPEYNYILDSYIKIYCTRIAGSSGFAFTRLLKTCGLDLTTLKLTGQN